MIRMSRGIVMKVALAGLCGVSLLAFGSAWGQPNRVRVPPKPVPVEEIEDDGQPVFQPKVRGHLVPYMDPNGTPIQADRFTIETGEIIDVYRQSSDDKVRAGLRTKLVAVLAKKFDSQQQRREEEINELKARLKQLTELNTKRAADRKGIIDRHADHLLREVDGLGWENDPPPMIEEMWAPTS